MDILSPIIDLFRSILKRKPSELVIDPTTFSECTSKEVRVWRWKRLKTIRVLVHFQEGKFITKELG